MRENEINLKQLFVAGIAGTGACVPLRVRAVTDDGRVVLCPRESRRTTVVANKEVLLKGGEVNTRGRLGILVFSPRIGSMATQEDNL